eukprot:TRINITY_DN6103_c0_g1_i1.p1 TRINITY_DN6103_c0_g1~~TRINITY_DN6103_c0_g1_i1.p1  ORF type:complete len:323 (+),score=61.66 TRINITY_DN6103_c0_g1_i1:399-1367(+)
MELISRFWRNKGPSGFGSSSTAEDVTQGINANGLTAIVTGGTSGIGRETVRVLALRGAEVIMPARNIETGNKVKEEILKDNPDAKVNVMDLDLSSLSSVRKFADSFRALDRPLNILINNAGIMACPFQLSKDGIELQFATNHLGHFLLTNLLLDKIKATAKETGIEGRIVNVSSAAHKRTYPEGIRLDNINDNAGYKPMDAYGQSKLANILHMNELSRRLRDEGANVTANSLHPGVIPTNITRHLKILALPIALMKFMLKTLPQGAATTCYLALHPNVKGVSGKYFCDCNEAVPDSKAQDVNLSKGLWKLSEVLVSKVDETY